MPRMPNIYLEAQYQGRLWTPAVLRPAAWFDGADLSTITNTATGISDWADKSGNGRNMYRATTTYRPNLLIERKNAFSVVQFKDQTPPGGSDYRGDRMQMSSRINVQTAYVAFNRRTPTLLLSNFVFTADGELSAGSYDWHGTGSTALADATYASTNWKNGKNYRNGASITITALGSGPYEEWAVYSFLCTGNMQTQGVGWDRTFTGSVGEYAEILWFSGAHSDLERFATEGYLAWKWGVPLAADHPFASRPPLIGD